MPAMYSPRTTAVVAMATWWNCRLAARSITLPFTGLISALGIWVDDRNNLLVANNNYAVLQLPLGGGSQITLPFSGLTSAYFPAVDAGGTDFVAQRDAGLMLELPGGLTPQTTAAAGLIQPLGVAVDSLVIFSSLQAIRAVRAMWRKYCVAIPSIEVRNG